MEKNKKKLLLFRSEAGRQERKETQHVLTVTVIITIYYFIRIFIFFFPPYRCPVYAAMTRNIVTRGVVGIVSKGNTPPVAADISGRNYHRENAAYLHTVCNARRNLHPIVLHTITDCIMFHEDTVDLH